jgi:hypothetical protein
MMNYLAAIAKGDYKFADADNGAKSTMTAILGRWLLIQPISYVGPGY